MLDLGCWAEEVLNREAEGHGALTGLDRGALVDPGCKSQGRCAVWAWTMEQWLMTTMAEQIKLQHKAQRG